MLRYGHPIIDEGVFDDITKIIRSGNLQGFTGTPVGYRGGEYVQRFEKAFADYMGVRYAIALNSATAALHAALIACGIGSGDEVIVTPYSFSASASCVLMVNGIPVFVDIEDETFNIDPDLIERAITPKTKAILPVHLCGHPADMHSLWCIAYNNNLAIIEDAAQAIGATYTDLSMRWHNKKVGTIGDCGIFSFNQSKHISTGEGGMLVTNDDGIAERVMAIRNHGEVSNPKLKLLGYNYRMCEIEAALGLAQLKALNIMNDYRIKLTTLMSNELSQIEGFTPPVTKPNCKHVFYTYAVKIDKEVLGIDKWELCKRLNEKGVYFGTYVEPLHLLPIYEPLGYGEGLCPVAERMWKEELIVTDCFRYPMPVSDVYEIIKVIEQVIRE